MPTAFDRLIASGFARVRTETAAQIVANGHTVIATIGASQVYVKVDNNGGVAMCDGMVALSALEVVTLGLDWGVEFTVAGEAMRVAEMNPDGAGFVDVHYRKAQ